MQFKTSKGQEVSLEEICALINAGNQYEVYVGTDSQVKRSEKTVTYATCIVLYQRGKGGKIFIWKEKQTHRSSLRQRLTNETWRSLQVSFELQKILPPNVDIIVHLDVNYKSNEKSSDYYQELVGMVVGQGFKCYIKPDSFVAMKVADKFTK